MIACILRDGQASFPVITGTDAWEASLAWARFHGLDPMRIPSGSTIVRDAANRRILFQEFAKDGPAVSDIVIVDGEPLIIDRVEQGEAPPLPFPSAVTG